jgi:hypothetical protein
MQSVQTTRRCAARILYSSQRHANSPCFTIRFKSVDSKNSQLLYEGPFADLALRLKVVSVTSAALGIVGIPILMSLHTGEVPPIGQIAVGGSAMLGAVGSTVAMSFVFSPYVSKLERVPIRKCHSDPVEGQNNDKEQASQEWLLKATTRNIAAMKVETVFDPKTDVEQYSGIRPFCNFVAKGIPLYVHPELILDDELRVDLVGEEEATPKDKTIKEDDDGFL